MSYHFWRKVCCYCPLADAVQTGSKEWVNLTGLAFRENLSAGVMKLEGARGSLCVDTQFRETETQLKGQTQ